MVRDYVNYGTSAEGWNTVIRRQPLCGNSSTTTSHNMRAAGSSVAIWYGNDGTRDIITPTLTEEECLLMGPCKKKLKFKPASLRKFKSFS
jgi:hypothetical protein